MLLNVFWEQRDYSRCFAHASQTREAVKSVCARVVSELEIEQAEYIR